MDSESPGGRRMHKQTSSGQCGKCWDKQQDRGDCRGGTDRLCRGEIREGFTEEMIFELGLEKRVQFPGWMSVGRNSRWGGCPAGEGRGGHGGRKLGLR